MKKLHSFAFYALVTPAITLGAGSVLAEPTSGQDMDREPQSTQRDKDATQADSNARDQSRKENRGYLSSAPTNGMRASSLIDAEVKTTGDEDMGTVSDLIIDKNGEIVAVVVGVGGFLGMGEKDVAIGWGHVTKSGTGDDQELKIDVTRESLRAAPSFDARKSALRSAEADQDRDQSTLRARSDRTRQSDTLAATDPQRSRDQSGMHDNQSRMNAQDYIDSVPVNGVQASNLIGAEVKTTGNENVGPVSDLIIDDKGQVVAVLVGVGGFLGMGERDVAIGWDDVTRSGTADEPQLRINATREKLRSAPEFKDEE